MRVESHESPMNSVARFTEMRVTLNTPEGPIRGSVQVDSGPIYLADLVSTAQELTNILVSRANRREEMAGRPISCRAGCGACCRQMVGLSIPECFYLADYLDSFEPARRKEVQERFDPAEAELTRHGITEFFESASYDQEMALNQAVDYFYLGIPCPFLIDESCGIHEHRPVVCREYNVTSPAVWCADPANNRIAKVPMPQPLSTPLARLTAELTDSTPRLIPLTLCRRFVAQHDDLRRRTWPGLELFQKFLGYLGELPASR